jgi:hypothetical protein
MMNPRPPHPVLLPKGRRNAGIIAEISSGAPCPIGERAGVRGSFAAVKVNRLRGFGMDSFNSQVREDHDRLGHIGLE